MLQDEQASAPQRLPASAGPSAFATLERDPPRKKKTYFHKKNPSVYDAQKKTFASNSVAPARVPQGWIGVGWRVVGSGPGEGGPGEGGPGGGGSGGGQNISCFEVFRGIAVVSARYTIENVFTTHILEFSGHVVKPWPPA